MTSSPTSAVSPITTPVAWSMNRPAPRTAPGWMSTPVRMRVSSANVRAASLSAALPQPVADSVAPDRVHARVGEDDLQRGGVGRIALPGRPYVAPYRCQHG